MALSRKSLTFAVGGLLLGGSLGLGCKETPNSSDHKPPPAHQDKKNSPKTGVLEFEPEPKRVNVRPQKVHTQEEVERELEKEIKASPTEQK